METKKRQKLCMHCDGEVDIDMIVCPFCGKDVSDQKLQNQMEKPLLKKDNLIRSLSPDETLNSLYPPPYRPKIYAKKTVSENEALEGTEEETTEPSAKSMEEKAQSEKKLLWPTLLFSLGINLCLFALFLLVFSKDGEVSIHWKSSLWIAYLLLSVPMLYFGYRKIS